MGQTVITNPIMWADVPDVDPIRVGTSYYMVSTSMHTMPGCPIMKSEDLMHWEIVGYVFDRIEDNQHHNLIDGNHIYGKGSWAASLKYHEGMYYVCFSSNDTRRFYIYRTDDIENGRWERSVIEGLRHDPALLFDRGRVYVISGCGSIHIEELTEDATALKAGGINQLLFETEKEGIGLRCEGCHAYRIGGYYYLLFIEWPLAGNGNGRRRQVCYRSAELLGPYERKVILDDDMGYFNNGVAQGGIFDTPAGDWYAMLFQDHGSVGRIPYVLPVTWTDGWPMIGADGKVPERFEVDLPAGTAKPLVISDDFDYPDNKLALNWQWNHNPDNRLWSVTARPGYLRLISGQTADSVLKARNTLTQRTEGPACSGSARLDVSGMKPGDHAGLVALQNRFGTVGVRIAENGDRRVVMSVNDGSGGEEPIESIRWDGDVIDLKIEFDYENSVDLARFYYSADGTEWIRIGRTLDLKYTLDHFMGYRIGLYYYASVETGGCADFECFRYDKRTR